MNEDELVELTIKSYDSSAEEYCRFHFKESFAKRLDTFIKLLHDNSLVLDVGCGCGRDTEYLLENKIRTIGIDLSKGIIEQAKKHVPKATFLQMDMRRLTFKDSEFHGILAMASILHIPKNQIPDLLTGFRRVLKDEGILYICVMVGKGEKLVKKSAAVKNMGPRFFAFYTHEEIRDLLNKANFRIEHSFIDRYLNTDWLNIYARK